MPARTPATSGALEGGALLPAGLPPDEAALIPGRLRWGAVVAAVVFGLLLVTEPLRPPEASLGMAGLAATAGGMALSLAVAYGLKVPVLGTMAYLETVDDRIRNVRQRRNISLVAASFLILSLSLVGAYIPAASADGKSDKSAKSEKSMKSGKSGKSCHQV